MGIILPQTVSVRIYGPTIKYYRELGYIIPNKIPCFIDVNVTDLPPKSEYSIYCNCDDCNKLLYRPYWSYKKSLETYGACYCLNCVHKGSRSYKWKEDKTQQEREDNRDYPEYNQFVKRVLTRDHYTCQRCGISNNTMIVHHMDGYDWCISKRIDDTNGITLCKKCHLSFHSQYGIGKNTKQQFEEWINKPIDFDKYTGDIHILQKIICLDNGHIYNDRNEVSKELGCDPLSLISVCVGRVAKLYGMHFAFYKDYINNSVPEKVWNDYLSHPSDCSNHRVYFPIDTREYKNMKVEKSNNKNNNRLCYPFINVLCLNDGNIYNFENDAVPYNIGKYARIVKVCNGIDRTCGILDNKRIDWFWLEDFQKMSITNQIYLAKQNIDTIKKDSYLYNLLLKYKQIL